MADPLLQQSNVEILNSGSILPDEDGSMQHLWHSFERLNASWTKKWWYSTVHNITAIVGAGVLGLPSSIAYLTWFPGITAIILLWVLSLVTYWQMTEMHERKDRERGIIKYDRYHELGQYLFGPKLGLWLVIPSQIMIEVGVDIVYILTAARSIQYIVLLNGGGHVMLRYCIIIFASIQLFLCQFKEITSITWISIIAAITAVCKPGPLVTMANLMLVFHMIGGYQIYAMPFFNKLEEFTEKCLHVKPRASIRILNRLLYVCSTCLVALAVPFFGELQGFIGGFGYLPSTYVVFCPA